MFKTKRKILSVILALVLTSLTMAQPISAAIVDESIIEPQWQNATNMVLVVGVNTPQIQVKVTVTGRTGTTYHSGTAVLEKISGSNCGTVKIWTNISSNTPVLQFTDNTVTRTSGTYRLTFTVTTVRNGVSETISASKEATY